jgi:hypothetical protein
MECPIGSGRMREDFMYQESQSRITWRFFAASQRQAVLARKRAILSFEELPPFGASIMHSGKLRILKLERGDSKV